MAGLNGMKLKLKLKLFSNIKWIFGVIFFAIFCRLFLVSVYKVSVNTMEPAILQGDLVIVSQVSYGFKWPWMSSWYFGSEPEIGDIIVLKSQTTEKFQLQKITSKEQSLSIQRDQILGRAIAIVVSIGTTQDSIYEEKSIRWNRFLTFIK